MKKKIRTALISLSDKSELKLILKILKKNNIKTISSGGTYKKIINLGYKCQEISKFTGEEEILNGRVKTLHPKIYAGILNKRNNKEHKRVMKLKKYQSIDLIIVNFYPFEKVFKETKNHEKIIENIDIGGPTLVRAAAKNYNDTVVITNKNQYKEFINELNQNKGSTTIDFRKKLSEEAFSFTSQYDALISTYLSEKNKNNFPKRKIIHTNLLENLRYGENPHQNAAIYGVESDLGIFQLHGKKLSYNNYNDIFAALNISKTLPKNTGAVIIKHANPCGVSITKNKLNSYKEAYACDPISAFGGIVLLNFKVTKNLAIELNKLFLEVIIGNGFDNDSLKILRRKKNLRLIDASNFKFSNTKNITKNFNSLLIQDSDNFILSNKNFKVVSKKKPNKQTYKKLVFAFNICRNVKSNAIVLTKDFKTVGIGSGQPSRLDSCKIAINKMKKFHKINSGEEVIAASDAFFPFLDGIETLVQSGVNVIVQPSGSIRDRDIIKFANRVGITLVFSKTRHFKH